MLKLTNCCHLFWHLTWYSNRNKSHYLVIWILVHKDDSPQGLWQIRNGTKWNTIRLLERFSTVWQPLMYWFGCIVMDSCPKDCFVIFVLYLTMGETSVIFFSGKGCISSKGRYYQRLAQYPYLIFIEMHCFKILSPQIIIP